MNVGADWGGWGCWWGDGDGGRITGFVEFSMELSAELLKL